jgi:hypothetical protein
LQTGGKSKAFIDNGKLYIFIVFEFKSDFDIVKRVQVGITVSDYTSSPEFILKNEKDGTFDGNKRWAASGIGQWMDFKFDQDIVIHGVNIAWYRGNERRAAFKIYANNRLIFNGMSGGTSSYEIYKFSEKILTDNLRITCFGNNMDQLNEITAVAFRCEPIQGDTIPEINECPPGQHWNEVLQKCVSDTIDQPPYAIIDQDTQIVKQGERVVLDGSQSNDPSTTPISFEWVQTGGELVKVSSYNEPTLMFKAPTIDTEIAFRLKVTNAGNLWATKDVKVLVKADPQGNRFIEAIKKLEGVYNKKEIGTPMVGLHPQEQHEVPKKSKRNKTIR